MDMNRIEEQARYYQNLPLRDRSVKAVVHLEDAEDELFWNHQLQKASPAAYHFLAYSKNDKGNEAHGCEQCLRYKSFLTSRFFIFLQDLSKVVYQPLLYLVHYSKGSELNQQWNITKFNACLPLQPKREELAKNGSLYLEGVTKLFSEAIDNLQQEVPLDNEHLDETNAYLHIQGHQLYKLVLHIGTLFCHGTNVAFKTDILDKALHTEGYAEIDNVQSDLVKITSAQ